MTPSTTPAPRGRTVESGLGLALRHETSPWEHCLFPGWLPEKPVIPPGVQGPVSVPLLLAVPPTAVPGCRGKWPFQLSVLGRPIVQTATTQVFLFQDVSVWKQAPDNTIIGHLPEVVLLPGRKEEAGQWLTHSDTTAQCCPQFQLFLGAQLLLLTRLYIPCNQGHCAHISQTPRASGVWHIAGAQ